MDGLREELLDYCLFRFRSFFKIEGDIAWDIVRGIAAGYVNLAYDCPNLYKYLYMTEHMGDTPGELIQTLCDMRRTDYDRVVGMLMKRIESVSEAFLMQKRSK